MNFKDMVTLNDQQYRRLEENRKNFERFAEDPDNARPAILIFAPGKKPFTIREQSHDPRKMLQNGLEGVRTRRAVEDDSLPALRVEFGTGQVANAYGCELHEQEDSPSCVKSSILSSWEEIEALENPSLTAGRFGELEEYTAFFRENAPDFVPIQLPDLQGPFNNAHLIRGNDILFDFYDAPEMVDLLLSKVTDYQIALTKRMHEICHVEGGFFYDWSALWKGYGRICNCSLHMISTEFYKEFVQKYDQKILDALGGGRIHYCGSHDDGLFDEFFSMKNMYGVDYDGAYHDLWELSKRAPKEMTLLQYMLPEQIERLLQGDWPEKRNIILQISVGSVEEGKDLYRRLRESMPF